jgi:succinate---hydroxymethylglutarate CoA-transferase
MSHEFVHASPFLIPHNSTGEPDRPPSKVGVAVTDISTGLYAHGAIMAALLSRQRTGEGVWIDCNLFDSQVRFDP